MKPVFPTSKTMTKTSTLPVYDSALRGSPALEELRELFRYRNLVVQMIRRDIVTRYKRSFLGIAWTMLNPLGTTIIMAIVFSRVFGRGGGYAAYLLSGLTVWLFFSQATNACMVGLLWGGNLLNRIYLPRTVFAISAVGTALINLSLSLIPLFVVMLATKVPITPTTLLLPIPTIFLVMFTLGMGLILSAITIYFPDVRDMYAILLTAWMYLSPVIFKPDMIPPEYLWFIRLNPMYYLINLFRAPIYDGRVPQINEILLAGAIAAVTLLIGWLVFAQKIDEFSYRV